MKFGQLLQPHAGMLLWALVQLIIIVLIVFFIIRYFVRAQKRAKQKNL